MTLDDYLQHTEELKQKIEQLPWHKDDVRHGFYGLLYSTLYEYYTCRIALELAAQIGKGNVLFNKSVYNIEPHVNRLQEIANVELLNHGYLSNLNRNILLGTWTSFETCVNLLFEHIATASDTESIIKGLNSKLVKAISHLEEDFQSLIINILKQSSFIPLARKFDFLVKKGNSYGPTLKKDRELIQFLGTLRNTMVHTNGIYYGKDIDYHIHGITFRFIQGEMLIQEGTNQNISWQLSFALSSVFDNLANCLKYIDFIEYPSEQL